MRTLKQQEKFYASLVEKHENTIEAYFRLGIESCKKLKYAKKQLFTVQEEMRYRGGRHVNA